MRSNKVTTKIFAKDSKGDLITFLIIFSTPLFSLLCTFTVVYKPTQYAMCPTIYIMPFIF